jgi:quinol monooxygenase YgiN
MHARVWQLRVRPGKLEEFKNALHSLTPAAQQQGGFVGALALGSGEKGASEVTLVALWESLDALRASERNMLVTQAISRFVGCCEGFPRIREQEVLASEFPLPSRQMALSARVI